MADSKDERAEQDQSDEQEDQSGEREDQSGEHDDQRDEQEEQSREQEDEGDEQQDQEDEVEPRELSQDELVGMEIIDPHGDKIGKIEALFIHQQDERASWARVKTGIGPLGSHVFVPLHDAQDDDGQIRVVYEKGHVDEAPEIEPEGNEISDEEADQLHGHYGLERVTGLATETKDEDIELPREARDAEPPTMNDPPWAVEKYPLPDMDRDNVRDDDGEGDEKRDDGEGDEKRGEDERDDENEADEEPKGRGEADDSEGEDEGEGEGEDRDEGDEGDDRE